MKTKELLKVVGQALSGCRISDADNKRHFLFRDGYIFVWSSAIVVSAKLPEDCKELTGILSSVDLYNVLNKIKADDIDIVCEPSKWVFTIGTKTVELNTKIDNFIESKCNTIDENIEWKSLPEDFYKGLQLVNIINNQGRHHGVYFNNDMLISTDEIRFNRYNLSSGFGIDFWLGNLSVNEILKISTKFNQFAVNDTWTFFRYFEEGETSLLFACNRLNENNYNLESKLESMEMCESSEDFITGTFPEELKNTLDLAQLFDNTIIDEQSILDNSITLDFTKSKLIVSSERDSGKFTDKLLFKDKLDIQSNISVKVGVKHLKDILNTTREFKLVSLNYDDANPDVVLLLSTDNLLSIVVVK